MRVLGGVLIPSVPPNSAIAPLWDPVYEPLWQLCEANDVVINIHSGSGLPDYGQHEAARAIMPPRPGSPVKFSGLTDRVSASARRQMLSSPTVSPLHVPSPATAEVYSRASCPGTTGCRPESVTRLDGSLGSF